MASFKKEVISFTLLWIEINKKASCFASYENKNDESSKTNMCFFWSVCLVDMLFVLEMDTDTLVKKSQK